jgi:hypothetical protein
MERPLLNEAALFYLSEARKWAKFLAIMGFIGIGLMVIGGIIMGIAMSFVSGITQSPMAVLPSGFFVILYLVMALIYFFPVNFLYRFSVKLGASLATGNEEELSAAFMNLKSLFKFMGILIIVTYSFVILGFIFSIFAAMFGLTHSGMQM